MSAIHNILASNVGNGGHPYWNSVVLLMHMDNVGLTDSSQYAITPTLTGNVTRSSTQSKFGGYSAYFDGTGDKLSFTDNARYYPGNGDFTIEMWVRSGKLDNFFFDLTYNGMSGFYIKHQYDGTIWAEIRVSGPTADYPLISSTVFAINTWMHIAAVRSGGSFLLFVNGVLEDSETGLGTRSMVDNYTGKAPVVLSVHSNFLGYIDELRYTKGTARYTSNFTIPTAAFPNC